MSLSDPLATSATVCRLVRSGRLTVCDDDLGVSRALAAALAQDRRGYLWVGLEEGVRLFDGLVWAAPASLAALQGLPVKALCATSDEQMWIGTDGGGLAYVDLRALPYRVVRQVGLAEGLPSLRVHTLCADARGRLWVGTHAGLALVAAGRVQRVLTPEDGLPSATIWDLCADEDERLWVGTKGGLALLVDDAVQQPFPRDAVVRTCGVQRLCRDGTGQLWVALVGGTILRATVQATGNLHVAPVCETEARVRALCPDAQGRVWVGTSAGMHLLEDGALRATWTQEDGLPAKEVWAVCADRAGRVWAGTSTGLALVADQTAVVQTLPPSRGALAGPIYAFAADTQGRLWLATESGLRAVDPATGAPLPLPLLPAPLAGETVWALQVDHCGRLWAGTDRHGLWAIDPQSGVVHAHHAPATQVPVLCLLGDGTLWASITGDGLLGVDAETGAVLQRVGPADGLPEANIQGLHADQLGRLWAGTWSGWLACMDPTRGVVTRTLALADDQARRPITDLTGAGDGLLWVSTYGGGLVCFDPTQGAIVRVITSREDLPSDLLYACRVDGQGRVWVGTRRGVACLTPETGRWITLGRSLGLPSEECNSHALYLDAQDQLWVGTVQGPAIVRTGHVPAVVPPCTVALTGLTVLGQERPLEPGLRLDETEYDLTLSYGAVTFTAAPQVVYRVWLEGLEPTWSAHTAHRVARYTNLRPGRYTFRVAARNWGGQWSAPAELPFEVMRNQAQQEMDEALERARIDREVALATAARLAELNRQLEDTDRLKTQLITQIRDQAAVFERLSHQDGLTGLLNRRALDERLAEEFARARRHQRPLSVMLADLDHFKRINDTYSHQVGDQVLKVVARLGQEVARQSDSLGRYGGEEFMLVLPETTAAQAWELCERWRQRIAASDWEQIAPGLRVTLSCGLTDAVAVPHHERMVAHADQALYRAKHGGRNRTCGHDEGRGHTPAA